MTPNSNVPGYGAATVQTERGTEYAVFARVTHRLKKAAGTADRSAFPSLAAAVADNQRLWAVLADDLRLDGNALPADLRANLLSLAEFVRRHSLAVLGGRGSVEALVDINTAIMKGLRGDLEVAA